MPAVSLSGEFNFQAFTDAGLPAASYRVYTYSPGTTTKVTAYTDAAGTVAHTYTSDGSGGEYIATNTRGELPHPLFFQVGGADVLLKTSTGVSVWTRRAVGAGDATTSVDTAIRADIANTSSTSKGAGMSGYGGAVSYPAGTVGHKLRQIVSIFDFVSYGTVDNTGVSDCSAAMTAAHATGKLIYYPAGTYLFEPTIEIDAGGIIGDGPSKTILKSNDTTSDNLIKFTGHLNSYSNIPTFKDFTLQGSGSKAGGAGIQVYPVTGEASYLHFSNVDFLALPIGIDFVAASLWKVIGCNFLSYTAAGIRVANTNTADSGDSVVSGCVFNNPFTTGSGIYQKSSGGLKILGNKFLGGSRGYTMALEDSTSVLIITGNSFENMHDQDIVLTQAVAGKSFVNVCITGNEFSVGDIAIATDAESFLTEVNISGNQINMGATGSNPCISLATVTDFIISGNLIKGNGGSGSSAITLVSCTNGKIGTNTYSNLPNPISITTCTDVSQVLDSQSNTAVSATSGWAAYGALYRSPLQTITFTQAFLVTPNLSDVCVMPTGANGELGAIVASVSKTQLTYYIISAVNSIAAASSWRVSGVL